VDLSIAVAVISALAAVVVALITSARTGRLERELASLRAASDKDLARLEKQLRTEERAQDRELSTREELDRFREPLMLAGWSLMSRIGNIRHRRFLSYFHASPPRDKIAILGTLYRVGSYLGWVQIVENQVGQLRLAEDDITAPAARTLGEVAGTFASDRFDRSGERSRLMLWREEQRAIGGLMRQEGHDDRLIGFETFVELYEARFAGWLDSFAKDLKAEDAAGFERLRLLENQLSELVSQLDRDQVLPRITRAASPASNP
jgi:hypothetical protein